MLENYVDVIEAAKILGVHPETVKRLIREGKLAAPSSATSGSWSETGSACLPTPMTEGAAGRGDCCERVSGDPRGYTTRRFHPPGHSPAPYSVLNS